MRTLSLLVVLLLALPALASAQRSAVEDALRLSLSFGGQFGGEAALRTRFDSDLLPDVTVRSELAGAPSLALRVVQPMHRFVSLARGSTTRR